MGYNTEGKMKFIEKYKPTSTKKYFNNYYLQLTYRLRKERSNILLYILLKK